MPPVRWKLAVIVTLLCFNQQLASADPLHDSMPMTSDGWKPIIGTAHRDIDDEITLYKNPSQTDEDSQPIKAQPAIVYTLPPATATKPYQTIATSKEIIPSASVNNNINAPTKSQGVKISTHPKYQKPFIVLPNQPNHGHGPHIPLSSVGHRGTSFRHTVTNKIHPVANLNGKRQIKPIRGPAIAHSMRNEVVVPAPSAAIGTFTFFNQPPPFHKGQGLVNTKPFHINQSPGHIEFNQFGLAGLPAIPNTNDVIIQQVPVQTYIIQNKPPMQNDNLFVNQNDEFTRNLVPPPFKSFQREKERQKVSKQKEQAPLATEQAATINHPQLIIGKHKDGTHFRTVVPDNIIVQLPPPFEQPQYRPKFVQQQLNDREPVEVQVTREKLKVFHSNVPNNYNPNEQPFEQRYSFPNNNKPIEQTKIYPFESFDVTKQKQENKGQTYKKPMEVETFPVYEEPKRERFKRPISEPPNFPTYEVTEGKPWQESFPPFVSTRAPTSQEPLRSRQPLRTQSQPMEFVFLPTPYAPDSLIPTSPTQDEVSSIYRELNNRNRQNNYDYSTLDPNFFNIKEVSTHYPIVGRPEAPTIFSIPSAPENSEFSNEIVTVKDDKNELLQVYQPVEEPEPTTMPPPLPPPPRAPPMRDWQKQHHRPQQRRRRPNQRTTTTTTEEPIPTTELYELQRMQSVEESYSSEIQRPQRRRRPTRLRTTQSTTTESSKNQESTKTTESIRKRQRIRYEGTRLRHTTSTESLEEMPVNHKTTESVSYTVLQPVRESFLSSETISQIKSQNNRKDNRIKYENEVAKTESKPDDTEMETGSEDYPKVLSYGSHYHSIESDEDYSSSYQQTTEASPEVQTETTTAAAEVITQSRRRTRIPTTTMTTTPPPTTTTTTELPHPISIFTPENEIEYDYSTQPVHFEPSKETITIQEIYNKNNEIENTTPTPTTTTTTATTSTTTEVTTSKFYRTRAKPIKYDNKNRPRFSVKEYRQRLNQYSTTTTEYPRQTSTTTESSRLRFPNRSRKPIMVLKDEEEVTERPKFTPKDPRHGMSIGSGNEGIPEKKVNTRLRPFGRYRSTTEPTTTTTTTTQKISIKPNIFSNLRRPPSISLRQRVFNKYNRTNSIEKSTNKPNEDEETTINYSILPELSTEPVTEKQIQDDDDENEDTEHEDIANTEIMKNESFLQSQRVSDLTSSAHREYDTPGLFKSVSPNSRIVPNYFTISTDDPILPIEAFFPNIKDKGSKADF